MRRLPLILALLALFAAPLRASAPDGWTAAWASAQMVPAGDQVVPQEWLEDATLRQVIRVGLAGPRLRLRLSNVFGTQPLAIGGVTAARSADNRTARIEPRSLIAVRFGGHAATVIPAGAEVWSDPVALPVTRGADLTISLYLPHAPAVPTGHPGSRATTYFAPGNHVSDETL
ncbi:MAG: SGNH/GDSL hydrolase family protein, partial [Porphyrobacter sp.]|nr:SGNH/GDSL hydrolase family protein [Porphyrobacter sp.]